MNDKVQYFNMTVFTYKIILLTKFDLIYTLFKDEFIRERERESSHECGEGQREWERISSGLYTDHGA